MSIPKSLNQLSAFAFKNFYHYQARVVGRSRIAFKPYDKPGLRIVALDYDFEKWENNIFCAH